MIRLVISFTMLLCSAANAEPSPCDAPNIFVKTEDHGLRDRVCSVVAEALPSLRNCHLESNQPVFFSFSDSLLSSNDVCLGLYHHGSNQIDLLTPESFSTTHEQSDFCDTLPETAHFDSVVVHELTHALLDQARREKTILRVDQEYIAYAMQLQFVGASVRDKFLSNFDRSSPIEDGRINEFILEFSPSVFAAASWLHFSHPEHGCGLVDRILRGEHTFWQEPF